MLDNKRESVKALYILVFKCCTVLYADMNSECVQKYSAVILD